MDKVYLKYDDNRPYVECDYGFAKEMLLLGFIYPLKKGDLTPIKNLAKELNLKCEIKESK